MPHPFSRRQFLRSAGGVTFLALAPIGPGLFAATSVPEKTGLPIFTALPYLQPGDTGMLVENQESLVVAWQTQALPAEFKLIYGTDKSMGHTAALSRSPRWSGAAGEGEPRFNYRADLSGLRLNTRYQYRVTGNHQTILEGYFTTRKPRGAKTRFVAFGDNSFGDISDKSIAYQAYRAAPDFVMNTGDNVYDGGLDNEYARYFFPVYNADVAEPRTGAPLLRSVPFYTVIANHDVHNRTPEHHPIADFDKDPDSLAYYTAMHLPLNGPSPAYPTPTAGDNKYRDQFLATAGSRFPRMANYSFDYADVHFLCLDSNTYIDPTDPALHTYIDSDLSKTDAHWKIVVYHHPAYNVGAEHYQEQHMRVLSPLLEAHGVDFCLHGHEHNYQRTKPLKFVPGDISKASHVGVSDRRVPGTFTLDTAFDGKTVTQPQGVIYITTGAGGKHLYDMDYTNRPDLWVHADDNNAPYVAKMVSDRHSLTVFDVDGHTLVMRQIDEFGDEIDRIKVTKPTG